MTNEQSRIAYGTLGAYRSTVSSALDHIEELLRVLREGDDTGGYAAMSAADAVRYYRRRLPELEQELRLAFELLEGGRYAA